MQPFTRIVLADPLLWGGPLLKAYASAQLPNCLTCDLSLLEDELVDVR